MPRRSIADATSKAEKEAAATSTDTDANAKDATPVPPPPARPPGSWVVLTKSPVPGDNAEAVANAKAANEADATSTEADANAKGTDAANATPDTDIEDGWFVVNPHPRYSNTANATTDSDSDLSLCVQWPE
jgi:hypothetical protein